MDRVAFVAAELRSLANPENARAMAAYMKTDMAFFGVKSPDRDPIFREMLRRYPIASRADYDEGVRLLWSRPHREEKYFAVGLARSAPEYVAPRSLALYKHMIITGAWWDFVDEIAAHLVGTVLLEHRSTTAPVMERWIDHSNMWLRRSALLAHLKHKDQTDESVLFDHCLRRAGETEFFVRKAIGWVLREYAKTEPGNVSRFLLAHRQAWSGLTFREASKHLDV